MTILPAARSTPLTLPQVWITSPSATSLRFASQTSFLSSSSMGLLSGAVANLDEALHHAVKVAGPVFSAERVVETAVKQVEIFVNDVGLGIGLVNLRLEAGHGLL